MNIDYCPPSTGAYSTHIAIREDTDVFPVPDNVPDELAATLNCAMATAVSAIRHVPSGLKGFGNAVVLGDGLLSVYVGMLLKERLNFRHVHIFGNTRSFRSSLLTRFGFIPDYNPNRRSVNLTGKVDVVVETAGSKRALEPAYALLRPGATLVLVGLVLPDSALPFTAEQIIRKNLSIHGIHNYNRGDLREAVEFLASNMTKYPVLELMGPVFSLEHHREAFEAANSKRHFRVFIKP